MYFFRVQKNILLQSVLFFIALLVLIFVLVFSAVSAEAASTPYINYQGKLTNNTGATVADGTYNMRFWLVTSPSVATTSAVWTESLTSTNKVQVTNGLFSVMLGSTSALTAVDFNQRLYLGVEVGGTGSPSWDGEMSPRKIIGSVPSAFEAKKLGGVASTSFLRSDQVDTATSLLTFSGGLISQSSSTILRLTTLTATTTNLVINGERFTDLTGTGLTIASNALTVNTSYLNTLYASTTAFNTCSELATILSGNTTGSCGTFALSASPTFTGTVNAAAATLSSTLTLSGTAANIALGSNYLSGDGGDEGVFVDSIGEVGVGTTTPQYNFHVYGSGAIQALQNTNPGAYAAQRILNDQNSTGRMLEIAYSGSTFASPFLSNGVTGEQGSIATTGAYPLSFGTANTQRMIITSTGNVGIGTSTPGSYKLKVQGLYNTFIESAGTHAVTMYPNNGGYNQIYSDYFTGGTALPLSLGAYPSLTALNILPNGNIGIGTSSPVAVLDIKNNNSNSTYTNNLSLLRLGNTSNNSSAIPGTGFEVSVASDLIGFDIGSNAHTASYNIGTVTKDYAARSGLVMRVNNNSSGGAGSSFEILTAPQGSVALSSRLIVDQNGNIGIGATAPDKKLSVAGGIASGQGTASDTDGRLIMDWSSNQGYINSYQAGYKNLTIDAQNIILQTTSGGNVGIGTTSPATKLNIKGRLRIEGLSVGDASSVIEMMNNAGEFGYFYLDNDGDFTFQTPDTSSAFTILNSGNVGIATTSPASKLEVYGDMMLSGASRYLNFNAVSGTSGYGFRDNSGTLQVKNSGGAWTNIPTSGTTQWSNTGSDIYFNTGNVGIGTASPGQALDVNGSIRIANGQNLIFNNASNSGIDFYGGGTTINRRASDGSLLLTSAQADIVITPAVNTIIATGKVGIGTTTPSKTLDVYSNLAAGQARFIKASGGGDDYARVSLANSVSTNYWEFAASPSNTAASSILSIYHPTIGNVMTMLGNGSVGIGDATPVALLDIGGSSSGVTNFSSKFALLNSTTIGTSAGNYLYPMELQGSAGNNVRLQTAFYRRVAGSAWQGTAYRLQYAVDNSFTDGSKAYVEIGAGESASGGGFLAFGTAGSDRLVINNSGYVGIGTISPDKLLTLASSSIGTSDSMLRLAASMDAVNDAQLIGVGDLPGGTINYVQFGGIVDAGASMAFIVRTKNAAGAAVPTERLRVTGTGNVGIGTTTPNQKLSIFNSAADAAIEFSTVSGANEKWTIGVDDSDGTKFKISSSSALGTNDRLVIDGQGRVGIGTSSPSNRLSIEASVSNLGLMSLRNTSVSGYSSIDFYDAGGVQELSFGHANTSSGLPNTNYLNSNGGNPITFLISNVEKMRLHSNGYFGIGTTTPSSRLTISNGATSAIGFNLLSGSTSNWTALGIGRAAADGYLAVAANTFDHSGFSIASDIVLKSTTANLLLIAQSATGAIRFGTGSSGADTEKMTILSGGNVGIGTTTPLNPLHIFTTGATNNTNTAGKFLRIGEGPNGKFGYMGMIDTPATGNPYFFIQSIHQNSAFRDIALNPSGGNVGIGTTSPLAKLTVEATNPYIALNAAVTGKQTGLLFYNNAALQWHLGSNYNNAGDGNLFIQRESGTGNIIFAPNGNGNFGIGTTNPVSKLQVTTAGVAALPPTSGTTPSSGELIRLRTSSDSAGGIGTIGLNTNQMWIQATDATALGTKYDLLLNPNGGNVGIGTTDLDAQLEVSQPYTTNVSLTWDAPAGQILRNENSEFAFGLEDSSPYGLYIQGRNNLNAANSINLNPLGGNIGIGTTSPAAKFEVYGDMILSGASRYLNFNAVSGTSGYGFRDNSGTLQVKNSGGAWTNIPTSGTTQWSNTASNIYFNTGNVGIGTSTPAFTLSTVGQISSYYDSNTSHSAGTAGLILFNAAGDRSLNIGTMNSSVGYSYLQAGGGGSGRSFSINPNGGNVGIGTTTPGALLDLGAATSIGTGKLLVYNTGSNQYGFGINSSEFNMFAGTSGNINFRTNGAAGTSNLYIATGGNVGVGTSTPGSKLSVIGSIAIPLQTNNFIGASAVNGILFDGTGNYNLSTHSTLGLAQVFDADNNGTGTFFIGKGASDPDSATHFFDVTNAGNVGIGTTTPGYLLTVAGTAYIGATTTVKGGILPLTNDTYDLGSTAFRFRDLYLGGETLHIGTSLTDEATFGYNTTSNILNIGTDSTSNGDIAFFSDDLYLDKSTGNVGIGTTTPDAKLQINNSSNSVYNLHLSNGGGSATGALITAGNSGSDASLLRIADYTDTTPFFTVTDGNSYFQNGNVGIGTTDPATVFEVQTGTNRKVNFRTLQSLTGVSDDTSYDGSISFSRNSDGSRHIGGIGLYNGANMFMGAYGDLVFGSGAASEFQAAPERMRITSAGNVGIGTTTPTEKLSVIGDIQIVSDSDTSTTFRSGAFHITNTAGTAGLSFDFNEIQATGADHLYINNDNGRETHINNNIHVLTSGNVGIGDTSPDMKLDVTGYGKFGDIDNDPSPYDNGLSVANNANTPTSLFLWQSGQASGHLGFRTGDPTMYLVNSYSDGLITNSAALALTNTGNVGIGTTSPSARLHIASAGTREGLPTSAVFSDATDSTEGLFVGYNSTSNYGLIAASDLGTSWGNVALQPVGGNVGIGTTTPNAKLTVYGGVLINGTSQYLNFGTGVGTSSYGIRDNAGTLQYKNSGGTWKDIQDTVTVLGGIYATTSNGSNVDLVFNGSTDSLASFSAGVLTLADNVTSYSVELWGAGGGGGSGNGGTPTAGGNSCFGTNSTACTSPTLQANGGGAGDSHNTSGSTNCSNSANGGGTSGGFPAGAPGGATGSDGVFGSGGGGYGGTGNAQCSATDSTITGASGGTASGGTINVTGDGTADLTSKNQGGTGGGGGGYTTKGFIGQTTMYYTVGNGGTAGTSAGTGGDGTFVIYYYRESAPGADLAELYPVVDQTIEAGDIVNFKAGLPITVTKAEMVHRNAPLAGIISTKPGLLLGDGGSVGQRPVALSGRVPTKVNLEGGPITMGDRIALSSVPGVGKKATPFEDSVGIAIDAYEEGADGQGTVTVFIDLQQGIDIEAIGLALLSTSTGSSTSFDFIGNILNELTLRLGFTDSNLASSISASSSATSTAQVTQPDTLWTRLMNLARNFVNGVLTVVGIKTDELCVGETCINEATLIRVLNALDAEEASNGNDSEENTGTTTPDTTPPSGNEAIPLEESEVDEIVSAPPAEEELISEEEPQPEEEPVSPPVKEESTPEGESTPVVPEEEVSP